MLVATMVAAPAIAVRGITIRDDRAPSLYSSLASNTLPQTGSVTGNGWIGSGTLISPTWVLTAGHVADPTANTFASTAGTRSIINRYQYPGLDIGLVKLNSPITSFTPIRLYNVNTFGTEVGKDVLIAGAGLQGTGLTGQQAPTGTFRAAQSLIEAFEGSDKFYTRFRTPGSGAADLEGSGVQGDSGGGVFLQVNSQWAIAGVQSQSYYSGGIENLGKYGSGGVYMRTGVNAILNWVLSYATDAAIVGGYVTTGPSWNVNSSGDWNYQSNWTGNTIPNGVGKEANLLSKTTSRRTVYNDKAITLGTLRFDNANSYQIAGLGKITIDVASGAGSITVISGAHDINLPLFLKDNTTANIASGATLRIKDPMTLVNGSVLTKSGAGTLSIQAPIYNAYAAPLVVEEGVMSAAVDLGQTNSLQVDGGDVQLDVNQHLASLDVTGGMVTAGRGDAVVVSTKALSLSGDGQIDLKNGRLVVDYTGASMLPMIQEAINSGSLASSTRADGLAIGYGEASDLFSGTSGIFAGEMIDNTSVIAALTVTGDATLDGVVDSADFNSFALHYGSMSETRWTQGDFDGDGRVSTLDFNLLAGQFGQSLPTLSSATAVPEPVSAASLLVFFAASRIRYSGSRRPLKSADGSGGT